MRAVITPGPLSGAITPPASKSQAHRMLIAAALAEGESRVENLSLSEDISATRSCMEALGASCRLEGNAAVLTGVRGTAFGSGLPLLPCGESGSTLRFLMPIALALRGGGVFTGKGRLMERPQAPYFAIFRERGIDFSRKDDTLTIRGVLTPGDFSLAGNVSSQFITGLLYALPLLEGDSRILLTAPLESRGYVDMTLDTLSAHGIRVAEIDGGWAVPGRQRYLPREETVEPDYSQASFFLAAHALGHKVTVTGLRDDSRQGDRVILSQAQALAKSGELTLDVRDCPDLVPALALMAALRDGVTEIVGAGRLRLKESDRLASVTAVLTALGAEITEGVDCLTLRGRDSLPGGVTVDSWNDHRIAMMAAIAATRCDKPVTVTGAQCVNKSYPDFWRDLAALGGKVELLP